MARHELTPVVVGDLIAPDIAHLNSPKRLALESIYIDYEQVVAGLVEEVDAFLDR